jgi:hypothetical protein
MALANGEGPNEHPAPQAPGNWAETPWALLIKNLLMRMPT